jgi:hypothetical protein
MVADSHICHEPSTGWQVIQPQSCEGQIKYFICRLFLNFCCPFIEFEFRALCDQLYNIAFPRLLDSDVPTVPASLIHVMPWTVIAASTPPLELDAPIQATASQFLLLDVPVFHRQSFGNMSF